MKKICSLIVLIGIILTLSSCDRMYVYSLDVKSLDENLSYVIDDEMYNSYQYYLNKLNWGFTREYSEMDFFSDDNDFTLHSLMYQFELLSQIDNTYNMSLKLLNNNKYGKDCKDNLIKCVSIPDAENFKFMDIETLGLSNVPLISNRNFNTDCGILKVLISNFFASVILI